MSTKSQTLKGFRDFLPSQMAVRDYVKKICVDTFELFGFQPLETPALEYSSVLMGKYGAEANKMIYSFKDKGGRDIGLRYDLTVSTARVLSSYNLPLPFKRYQIQPVWRADKPQKGRYREFTQCDIDTFGSCSPLADAEIIAVIYHVLTRLNFQKFSLRINSRTLLKNIPNCALQSIDKLGKIGNKRVQKELINKGYSQAQIDQFFEYIKTAQPDAYLNQVFKRIIDFGVPAAAFTFDPTLVRGLDYYTGPIFEVYVEKPKIGSIAGGGRYDNLVRSLGGPDIPAVGTTLGLDRIIDCILELNLLPQIRKTNIKVLVANFGEEKKSLELLNNLRKNKIPSTIYFNKEKLVKQIKYALSLGAKYIAIIGPDEAKNNTITLKNLDTQDQQTISFQDLVIQLLTNA
ncbi:MAG TPA: histidine--tRNA ligase [Candidatus Woesebacteria bacterium]|nr:histidine--tRNA ligase [Candidatus Woesebacteria bacterium]HRS22617.1 histidine--tRNA ligase [Candidatus Woesebacteria bacterium]